jgi:hypothetical protein
LFTFVQVKNSSPKISPPKSPLFSPVQFGAVRVSRGYPSSLARAIDKPSAISTNPTATPRHFHNFTNKHQKAPPFPGFPDKNVIRDSARVVLP